MGFKLFERKNDQKQIDLTLRTPLYVFTALSIIYIILMLFVLPFGVTEDGVKLRGINYQLNLIMVGVIIYSNLTIRAVFETKTPIIIFTMFIRFAQVMLDYLVFKSSTINYYTLLICVLVEIFFTMFEMYDSKLYKYTHERIEDIPQ